MRHVTLALALSAIPATIPATAFAQEVSCPECRHVAPYFRGEGGFIGTVAAEAEDITFLVSCGTVTISGEARVHGGTASQLFNHRNGLACDQEGGLQIAGLKDGGWYWITDEENSAVGNLVAREVLDNDTVDLTSAGAGVTMSAGKGAVFLKETSTGRVGILPNILPRPRAERAEFCGPRRNPSWPYAYDRQMTGSCVLGGANTKVRLIGPGAYNSRAMITTGSVTRPVAGEITVSADLWVDESGSYSTDTSDNGGPSAESIRKGWVGTTASGQDDHNANWLTATFSLGLSGATPQTGDLAGAGVTLTADGSGSTPPGQATITIAASDDYCPSTGTQHTATIRVYATPGENAVHPAVAVGRDAGFTRTSEGTYGASARLAIVCAPR